MIRFNLDKNVDLSFYDQIKGQLLSAIYCGKITEGDRLPSIRELAEDLEVNYKTVRKIYLRLVEEQYLEMAQGSGAFLKKRPGEAAYEQMRRRAIIRLFREVSEKSRNLGLSPQKFLRLFESYTTGANLKMLRLAVVDHEEEAFIFSKELAVRLGAEVISLPLEKTEEFPRTEREVEDVDYLLTTSWHLDQVREYGRQVQKPVLELKPSHEIYKEILEVARHRNTAIVIQDEHTMHASWDVFMQIYRPTTTRKFWIAPMNREDLIETILREAEVIFVSPMCWDEMRRRTPLEKELKTYANFISEETISHLRELQLMID